MDNKAFRDIIFSPAVMCTLLFCLIIYDVGLTYFGVGYLGISEGNYILSQWINSFGLETAMVFFFVIRFILIITLLIGSINDNKKISTFFRVITGFYIFYYILTVISNVYIIGQLV